VLDIGGYPNGNSVSPVRHKWVHPNPTFARPLIPHLLGQCTAKNMWVVVHQLPPDVLPCTQVVENLVGESPPGV
jgi:hypothetical protein